MLTINKDIEYALLCLTSMANRSGPNSAHDMAEELRIPQSLLSKILQKLQKAGIVRSTPGVRGGYHIAMGVEEITLKLVAEALHNKVQLTNCSKEKGCIRSDECLIRPALQKVHRSVTEIMESTSIADILEKNG